MKSSFVALSAFAALVAAVPLEKRDIAWVTEVNVVTKVVDVTETVWVTPGATSTPEVVAENNVAAASAPAAAQQVKNSNQDRPHNHILNHHGPVTTPSAQPEPYTTPATTPAVVVQTTPATTPVAITSTTSQYVAPPAPTTPSTTPSVAPTTGPAPQQSSQAPPAYSPPASGSGSGSSGGSCADQSGECSSAKFTYYTAGMGSCGVEHTDSDYIFAYAASEMQAKGGANPNLNPLCGRKIAIKCYDGSTVTATLADTCPGCSGPEMLDLTPSLWNRVAKGMPGADGVLRDMSFEWL